MGGDIRHLSSVNSIFYRHFPPLLFAYVTDDEICFLHAKILDILQAQLKLTCQEIITLRKTVASKDEEYQRLRSKSAKQMRTETEQDKETKDLLQQDKETKDLLQQQARALKLQLSQVEGSGFRV